MTQKWLKRELVDNTDRQTPLSDREVILESILMILLFAQLNKKKKYNS